MNIHNDWHKTFFRNSFYNPVNSASLGRAAGEVAFIIKKTGVKKREKILDVCCGPGRHSVPLAEKGFGVTGVDFSSEYLKEARERARAKGVKARFVRKDARKLGFRAEFGLAVNLFTSFGYFKSEEDDRKVLRGVFRSLRPGGLFLMDFLNPDFLRKNYRRRNWQELEDGSYLLEETVLSRDRKHCLNEWTRIKKGKVLKKRFFLRLYDRKRISRALKKAGFLPLSFWGGFKGERLSPRANRLIVLAQKP